MSAVYKSIEMVGTSPNSFDEAVKVAVHRAGQTMRDLEWVEVMEQRGFAKDGELREFQVKLKVWFKLDDAGDVPG